MYLMNIIAHLGSTPTSKSLDIVPILLYTLHQVKIISPYPLALSWSSLGSTYNMLNYSSEHYIRFFGPVVLEKIFTSHLCILTIMLLFPLKVGVILPLHKIKFYSPGNAFCKFI